MTLSEALAKAKEQELDLVEVAPNVNPPVAKIVDFQKFKYLESKKEQAAKKNARDVELKEIWVSPRIADHDLNVRLRKAQEFLAKGDKVKLTVKFRGREMAHPEVGYAVVKQVLEILKDKISVERETRFEGRNLTTILASNKKASIQDAENKN